MATSLIHSTTSVRGEEEMLSVSDSLVGMTVCCTSSTFSPPPSSLSSPLSSFSPSFMAPRMARVAPPSLERALCRVESSSRDFLWVWLNLLAFFCGGVRVREEVGFPVLWAFLLF